MRSITSPSTRRSRASSLRGGGGRGKASGEVSVCRGVPSDAYISFSLRAARGRDGTTRENRVAVSCGETGIVPRELTERFVVLRRAARHRRARRTLPAARLRSMLKSPLNTREKQVAQANSLKPTRRRSLWASISPPRRGFPRSNGAVVKSSDDRRGVALPAPWTWATEASGSTPRVRRRVTRVGGR